MATKKKATKRGGGRAKPKMPKGFKKGEMVRVGRKHGKLPTGEAEVVGGCYGKEDYVNVMFRGAGGKGRPRLGCVPIASLSGAKKGRKKAAPKRRRPKAYNGPLGDADIVMAPTEIAGISDNPWLENGGPKKQGKKVYPTRKTRRKK